MMPLGLLGPGETAEVLEVRGAAVIPPVATKGEGLDAVVPGRDTHCSPHLGRLIDEALSRHIPVVAESCLYQLEGM